MDEKEKALAVGNIPSGLYIVCTSNGTKKDGFLASWVQQISFSPLLITMAINKGRPGFSHIMDKKPFTINIVSESEMDYLKYFWKGYPEDSNPFAEIPHEMTKDNGILIKKAKSVIECRLKEISYPGDHGLAVAEVLGSYVLNDEAKSKVHLRKSGLDY